MRHQLSWLPLAAALLVLGPPSPANARPARGGSDCDGVGGGAKRARCLSCVANGGRFQTQGRKQAGFCQPGKGDRDKGDRDKGDRDKGDRDKGDRGKGHRGKGDRDKGRRHTPPPPPPPPPRPHRRPPPPPPPPTDQVLDAISQCQTLGRSDKRARCFGCVRRPGRFHSQGRGAGYCQPLPRHSPPPPPPRHQPPQRQFISSPGECNAIPAPPKRRRCKACLRTGRVFDRQPGGTGLCRHLPPPPPPPPPPSATMTRPWECRRLAHPGQRAQCSRCVERRGAFRTNGRAMGECMMPNRVAPPPPPPSAPMTRAWECRRIPHAGKREHCLRCVGRGGVFHAHVRAMGECEMPSRVAPPSPPPPPPQSVRLSPSSARPGEEVRLQLSPPRPRARVFFNGQMLPKKTLAGGSIIVVTVPGNARHGGVFEIEVHGRRYQAEPRLHIRR